MAEDANQDVEPVEGEGEASVEEKDETTDK